MKRRNRPAETLPVLQGVHEVLQDLAPELLKAVVERLSHKEGRDVMDRVMRLNEVKRITGLSRTTIWELERAGRFPKHVQLTAKAIGWLESQIDGWMETLAAPPPTEPARRPNLR